MELLYIAIALMVVVLIYQQVVVPLRLQKKMIDLLSELENLGYNITIEKNQGYQYAIENKDQLYLVAVCNIPSNSTVTINSKDTWHLAWGGNPKDKGRSYRHDRYLSELTTFLKRDYHYDKPTTKIIMLYPSTEKVLRYLNESELDIITPKETPYGYKVTTYKTFIQDFHQYIEKGASS